MTARVALIGANGHGRWHRRNIGNRLVGLADLQPISPPPDAPAFTDHRELLAETRPDVVVICTQPHTHLPIALDALDAGCDLLLEKPPVTSLAAHHTLPRPCRERAGPARSDSRRWDPGRGPGFAQPWTRR